MPIRKVLPADCCAVIYSLLFFKCQELSARLVELFRKHRRQLQAAVERTPLAARGWDFPEVAQYVYASIQRGARKVLEKDGTLAAPKRHSNGVDWVFWAEEPKNDIPET
jgi:hypothetical protein